MTRLSVSQALEQARTHYAAGRIREAEAICRAVLRAAPEEHRAYRLLALAEFGGGDPAAARELLERAISLAPGRADYYDNLGLVLTTLGHPAEAETALRQALALAPTPESHNNLANALNAQRRYLESEAECRTSLAMFPGNPQAENNLGNSLRAQGRLDEAEAAYRRALALLPRFAVAENNLGVVLQAQARPAEAEAAFRRALAIQPGLAAAENGLGHVLQDQGRFAEAAAAHRRALAADRCYADAYNDLGAALRHLGQLDESLAACRKALELDPGLVNAYNNLGCALQGQGRLEEAKLQYYRALELNPQFTVAHSNALYCEQYDPQATPWRLAALHAEWDRRHAAALRGAWRPHAVARDPQRSLRLGFVSGDFGRHPVGRFSIRILEALRGQACQVLCYANSVPADEITARFAALSTWREVAALGDDALAEQIRADRIDVLFDLAGHSAFNRLPVFARKPAPLQITWIGYEGTTGLRAMDYLLADACQIRPEEEPCYVEKVLRLPTRYVCYDPPSDAPPVRKKGISPICRNGPEGAAHKLDLSPFSHPVTFGCFNNPAKITAEVLDTWGEILRRVPRARLVLKYRGLGDETTRRRLGERLAAQGVEGGRLEMQEWSPFREFLAAHDRIDLMLDPFPFSGSLTTCDALWMGVPVITWPGATFASRHSAGHLAAVGLTELVAEDRRQYVELAVRWADDRPRRTALRAGLRRRLAESPLCDGPRAARELMDVVRGAWRAWLSGAEERGETAT